MRGYTLLVWRVMCSAAATCGVIYKYFIKYFTGIDIKDNVDYNEVVLRAVSCKEIVLAEAVNLILST